MTILNPTVAAGLPFSAYADLDGDGLNELVITRSHPAAFMPNIYNGTQTSTILILSFTGGQPVDATARLIGTQPPIVVPSGLLVGDYNSDGRKDIFVADTGVDFHPYPGGQQHVLLSGPGGRLTPTHFGPLTYAHSSAAADIDHDGDLDIYISGSRPGDAAPYLMINNGSGGFTLSRDRLPSFLTETSEEGIFHTYDASTFADANRDGYQDLILIPKFTSPNPLLLLNNGTGSFANSTPINLPAGIYGPGSESNGVTKGTQNWTNTKIDLNRDGYEDLILAQTLWDSTTGKMYAGGRLQVLLNDKGEGYSDGSHLLVDDALPIINGYNYFDPHVTDLNGDGWSDLVVATVSDWSEMGSRVFMNDGTGCLVLDKTFPTASVLFPTDADGDGKAELVRLKNKLIGSTSDGLGVFSTTVDTLNLVYGTSGKNKLIGGTKDDYVNGGASNDTIYGSAGNDILVGGSGKDYFVFNKKANKTANVDQIVDYSVKNDTIWLDNAVYTKLGKGSISKPVKLQKDFFTVGPKAKDKNDHIVYDKNKGILFYDADGSGSKYKPVEIATLSKKLGITYKDFFVI